METDKSWKRSQIQSAGSLIEGLAGPGRVLELLFRHCDGCTGGAGHVPDDTTELVMTHGRTRTWARAPLGTPV